MPSSAQTTIVLRSSSVLGKRKAPGSRNDANLVLHLASSPEPSNYAPTDSEVDRPPTPSTSASRPPVLVNGTLVPYTKKIYKCTYAGCSKAYSKPSRLAEHERSHTGDRPFVCETCNKSYLRETHLHAHVRSHLPESARPLMCEKDGCGKRFWTAQHLQVHMDWHNGAKPFVCSKLGCTEAFAKHHQLRAHLCSIHAPPGTKPYQCEHEGCTKSFATNQHLRAHVKTHDAKRYVCIQSPCLAGSEDAMYFPTWTALQHHIRTAHPPTCSHPDCDGRTFSNHKGLRAHQKLHDEQELEREINAAAIESGDEDYAASEPKRKKRRGGEVGRDWKCEFSGCGKEFKSKKALVTHNGVTHLGRRDFVCPYEECGRAYGYKHLLQRHLAKSHTTSLDSGSDDPSSGEETAADVPHGATGEDLIDIDAITGNAYAMRARTSLKNPKTLLCPYPDLENVVFESVVDLNVEAGKQAPCMNLSRLTGCEYFFSRAYDLRRHLRAVHGIEAQKESLDDWMKVQRQRR